MCHALIPGDVRDQEFIQRDHHFLSLGLDFVRLIKEGHPNSSSPPVIIIIIDLVSDYLRCCGHSSGQLGLGHTSTISIERLRFDTRGSFHTGEQIPSPGMLATLLQLIRPVRGFAVIQQPPLPGTVQLTNISTRAQPIKSSEFCLSVASLSHRQTRVVDRSPVCVFLYICQ